MKKQAIIFVMLFFVSLFLAPNVSAFYGLQQIITGKFEAYESWDPMSPDPVLTARVSVVGSADISPSGSLETSNAIPETDQETINDAFTGFAESLNCTVGNVVLTDDPMFMGRTSISFVCHGTNRDVLNKTANLLSFPLRFVANAEP